MSSKLCALAIVTNLSVAAAACEDTTGPQQAWVFVTNARLIPTNIAGRAGADAKCVDMYQYAYAHRQCTNTRAVIQVGNDDSLSQMASRYGVPEAVSVKRADDATTVANNWRDFIDPNTRLLAAVNPTIVAPSFWSGMGNGVAPNNYCEGWTSASHGHNGDSGDASKTSGWQYIGGVQYCDTAHRLLCACW
jgi:hypothetical protein